MKTVEISVTAEHIENGHPGSFCECAIALALLESIPDAADAVVRYDGDGDRVSAEITTDAGPLYFNLPNEAYTFVCDFDNRDEPDEDVSLRPFTFQLEVPEVES